METSPDPKYFIHSQAKWIDDNSPLKILEKSRQVGGSNSTDYRTVVLVSAAGAHFDAFISTRDNIQAKLSLQNCFAWADFFHTGAVDLGEIVFDPEHDVSAFALELANGKRIYALSSNPNALAGKCGHIILDEFALHKDQRLLYRIAKPATTWGGTMTILSTHRGLNTEFNRIIVSIVHGGNPMGWSHHKLTLHQAVRQGLVERINKKSGRKETRLGFIRRLRAECIDEESWLQEYCCQPADENSAFFSYDLITSCEEPGLNLMTMPQLWEYCRKNPACTLYLGMDVARKKDLCVIDVGEKVGDVTWDRLRLEFQNRRFAEIEDDLHALLKLPQLKRACIDSSPIGTQMHERAKERFGWKVEGLNFSAPVKAELAYGLRAAFEDRKLRIVSDDKLRADLRALRKEVTSAGNIRFDGDADDSHCDRTWALALRQHAVKARSVLTARLG
jgi:phage FluMu gp28-like protein